jgi:glucose-6-phosphate 1-dehydrogenase
VAEGSDTETMTAVRAEIDKWRWAGVPFFLRSGKCLATSRQVLTLGFHQPPLRMFPIHNSPTGGAMKSSSTSPTPAPSPQDSWPKEPGAQMRLEAAEMTVRYADSFGTANSLEGYERLLLDAMHGDQSLFTNADAIERPWEISAPLLDNPPPTDPCTPGSRGPQPALDHLTVPYHWHLPGAGSPS